MPARDDADLVNRVRMAAEHGHQCMAGFMKCHPALLLGAQAAAFPLRAGHDFFHGRLQMVLGNPKHLLTCGQQRGLIHDIREVRT